MEYEKEMVEEIKVEDNSKKLKHVAFAALGAGAALATYLMGGTETQILASLAVPAFTTSMLMFLNRDTKEQLAKQELTDDLQKVAIGLYMQKKHNLNPEQLESIMEKYLPAEFSPNLSQEPANKAIKMR